MQHFDSDKEENRDFTSTENSVVKYAYVIGRWLMVVGQFERAATSPRLDSSISFSMRFWHNNSLGKQPENLKASSSSFQIRWSRGDLSIVWFSWPTTVDMVSQAISLINCAIAKSSKFSENVNYMGMMLNTHVRLWPYVRWLDVIRNNYYSFIGFPFFSAMSWAGSRIWSKGLVVAAYAMYQQ